MILENVYIMQVFSSFTLESDLKFYRVSKRTGFYQTRFITQLLQNAKGKTIKIKIKIKIFSSQQPQVINFSYYFFIEPNFK
jgi:hypothetical protein